VAACGGAGGGQLLDVEGVAGSRIYGWVPEYGTLTFPNIDDDRYCWRLSILAVGARG
jgi:hypothetical protein